MTVKNILYIYKKFNYPSIYLYASNHTAYKERKDMTKEQNEFFQELANIQEYCINVALSKKEKYHDMEELLKDVTCEVVYRIMELLDGYGEGVPRCDIINTVTSKSINEGIELHDKCMNFLENPFSVTTESERSRVR